MEQTYKKIDMDTAVSMLKDHQLWLSSCGKEGKQAVFTGYDLSSCLLQLENKLKNLPLPDSLSVVQTDKMKYKIFKANVIKNSYRLHKNYLTIDKGSNDGMRQDMGVPTQIGRASCRERV